MKPIVSYAQNLEDVMILRTLSDVEKGFYIDVGAHDPIVDSVTKALYEDGWHGINVEPVPHWHKKLQADRPRDLNLELALGSKAGRIRLIEFPGTGLSTTQPDIADRHRAAGFDAREHEVELDTLDAICKKYAVNTVHLLKIDVEGAEKDVLSGAAFTEIRPWLVVVEATIPMSQKQNHEDWQELLTSKDYLEVYFDGLNRFYLAKEQEHRADSFALPPNVFDQYTRYTEKIATERLAELKKEHIGILATLRKSESERRTLKAECKKITKNNLDLTARNEALLIEMQAARERIFALENSVLTTREGSLRVMEEWHSIIRENREIKDSCSTIEAVLASMKSEIRGFHEAMRKNAEMQAQLSLLNADNTALRSYIAALQASTSWRLTAPVRGIKTAVMSLNASETARSLLNGRGHRARIAGLARWAARKSILRRMAIRTIALHPGIEPRLRRLMTAPAPPPSFTESAVTARAPTAIPIALGTDLSATERRVLTALKRADRTG